MPDFTWAHDRWTKDTIQRMARAYGSRLSRIVGTFGAPADPGAEIAPGLYEAELRYLRKVEFARTAEDVLWRRSKLGLHLPAATKIAVEAWFSAQLKMDATD